MTYTYSSYHMNQSHDLYHMSNISVIVTILLKFIGVVLRHFTYDSYNMSNSYDSYHMSHAYDSYHMSYTYDSYDMTHKGVIMTLFRQFRFKSDFSFFA